MMSGNPEERSLQALWKQTIDLEEENARALTVVWLSPINNQYATTFTDFRYIVTSEKGLLLLTEDKRVRAWIRDEAFSYWALLQKHVEKEQK